MLSTCCITISVLLIFTNGVVSLEPMGKGTKRISIVIVISRVN